MGGKNLFSNILYPDRALTKHNAMNMKKKNTNTMKTADKNWSAKTLETLSS